MIYIFWKSGILVRDIWLFWGKNCWGNLFDWDDSGGGKNRDCRPKRPPLSHHLLLGKPSYKRTVTTLIAFLTKKRIYVHVVKIKCFHSQGVQKSFHPTIPNGSTWSKFGARGEHGDVFLFSNLGALWFSENLIRYSLHICLREVKNNLFSLKHPYLRHFSWRF